MISPNELYLYSIPVAFLVIGLVGLLQQYLKLPGTYAGFTAFVIAFVLALVAQYTNVPGQPIAQDVVLALAYALATPQLHQHLTSPVKQLIQGAPTPEPLSLKQPAIPLHWPTTSTLGSPATTTVTKVTGTAPKDLSGLTSVSGTTSVSATTT